MAIEISTQHCKFLHISEEIKLTPQPLLLKRDLFVPESHELRQILINNS